MGKTPHTAFRFSEETRDQLAKIAEQMGSLTEAARAAIAAFAPLAEVAERQNRTYPFEAFTEACMAYRESMGYEPGEILSSDVINAIDQAVIAANPIIREEQHFETLADVIVRLDGFRVDKDVVQHFRDLRGGEPVITGRQ